MSSSSGAVSSTTDGRSAFHETVKHRTKPGVWMLNGIVSSPSSRRGEPLDEKEEELLQSLKRNASPYPIKHTSGSKIKLGGRHLANWNYSDEIFSGECKAPGCDMKFKGSRVDGWIALYVYGVHGCHDDSPSRGLKGEAKVRADAAVLSGRRSDSVFDSFNRESASERKKLLSTEGQENPPKEKRKLRNYMHSTKRKQKSVLSQAALSIASLTQACNDRATTLSDFYDKKKDLEGYPTDVDENVNHLRYVHVLESDVGKSPHGEWTFIAFTVTSAARSARMAAELCKNRPLGESDCHLAHPLFC